MSRFPHIPAYGEPVAPVTISTQPAPPPVGVDIVTDPAPAQEIPSYGEVPSYGEDPLIRGSWHQLPQIDHPVVVAGSAPVPTYGDSNYSSPSPTSGTPAVIVTPEEYSPTEKVVAGSVSKTYLTGSEHGMDWTWEQIRDYVVAGIEENTGYFPRNPLTEAGIFKSFKSRWGDMAGPIAIYAIRVAGGWWQNAPISVNRFCKGSDEYFAKIINGRLEEALAQSA